MKYPIYPLIHFLVTELIYAISNYSVLELFKQRQTHFFKQRQMSRWNENEMFVFIVVFMIDFLVFM